MANAKDCRCIKCGEQAEVFFGLADPDGEQEPYCRSCVEKAKMRIYEECSKIQERYDEGGAS